MMNDDIEQLLGRLTPCGVCPELRPKVLAAVTSQFISLVILKAQVLAYDTVFRVSSVIVLCGAFLALLIKVQRKKSVAEAVFID